MRLRYIALYTDSGSKYNSTLASDFCYNIRFICNYLSKAVRKKNAYIELDEVNMISVMLSQKECSVRTSVVDKARIVTLNCSEEELRRIISLPNETERYEYYLSFLEEGYRLSGLFNDEQLGLLLSLHQQFRENGYRNEWLFKKKPIRDFGIYIYFKCYFTTYDFRLELEVFDLKQTKLLTKGVVMRTAPDEIFYDKDFKKIVINNNYLTVLDFLGYPFCTFDLIRLSAGDFHVYYSELEKWNEWAERFRKTINRLISYSH